MAAFNVSATLGTSSAVTNTTILLVANAEANFTTNPPITNSIDNFTVAYSFSLPVGTHTLNFSGECCLQRSGASRQHVRLCCVYLCLGMCACSHMRLLAHVPYVAMHVHSTSVQVELHVQCCLAACSS